jgi:hypothetical protein
MSAPCLLVDKYTQYVWLDYWFRQVVLRNFVKPGRGSDGQMELVYQG